MTDLVRRALLGDREAQKECTAQGIALPCPFCSREITKIRGYMGLTFYKCRTCGATVSFDLPKYNKGLANTDAACTGGPETGFYCALYGMEAHDGKTLVKNLSPGARLEWKGMMWTVIDRDERGTVILGDKEIPREEIQKLQKESDDEK